MNLNPTRFQFSIARMFACITLLAIALWLILAHPGIPSGIPFASYPEGMPPPPTWTVFQPYLVAACIGAAFGVLAGGKHGAFEGFKGGLFVSLHVLAVIYFGLILYNLFNLFF